MYMCGSLFFHNYIALYVETLLLLLSVFCWEFSRARWHVKHGTVQQSTGIIRAESSSTQLSIFFSDDIINIKCHLSFERHPSLFYILYRHIFSPIKQSSPSSFFSSPYMKLLCFGHCCCCTVFICRHRTIFENEIFDILPVYCIIVWANHKRYCISL